MSPIEDREYMRDQAATRRAIRWRGHSLGWPYCVVCVALGLNWLWDIFDRIVK